MSTTLGRLKSYNFFTFYFYKMNNEYAFGNVKMINWHNKLKLSRIK